jgi:predicted cupin superfamily sugar epimerase
LAAMNSEAQEIIAKLGLMPLPREGGWFRRTWQSPETFRGGRSACSSIYFLLASGDFSALHRLQTPEIWHFYGGDPVEHVQLDPADQSVRIATMGVNVLVGQQPQLVVPPRTWQGARLARSGFRGWALLGCTLVPAWDEAEFELGDRMVLSREFPLYAALVRELTR